MCLSGTTFLEHFVLYTTNTRSDLRHCRTSNSLSLALLQTKLGEGLANFHAITVAYYIWQ